jgi:hypothetical protein
VRRTTASAIGLQRRQMVMVKRSPPECAHSLSLRSLVANAYIPLA